MDFKIKVEQNKHNINVKVEQNKHDIDVKLKDTIVVYRGGEPQTLDLEYVENGEYIITPDEGYLLEQVNINVNVPTGEEYGGEYTIIPSIEEQSMNTKDKLLKENVTIEPIPYYETSNESGKTVYIGDKYE